MNKYKILSLCVWLLLLGCSSDPKPDPTEPFVGSWKTYVQDFDEYTSQQFWEIQKTAPGTVRISGQTITITKDDESEPYVTDYNIEDVKILESGEMKFIFNRTHTGIIFSGEWSGRIVNNELTVTVQQALGSVPTSSRFVFFRR